MFELTRDKEIFRKFWRDELENTPSWLAAGSHAWTCTEDDYLEFCDGCERIYIIDGTSLVYVENVNENANVHFSVLRGSKANIEDMLSIRDILINDYQMVFGWCGSKNWGLKKVLTQCQLKFYGFTMLKGWHRNRPMEWHCFSLSREQFSASNSA